MSNIYVILRNLQDFLLPPPLLLDEEAFRRRTEREQFKHRLVIFYIIEETSRYFYKNYFLPAAKVLFGKTSEIINEKLISIVFKIYQIKILFISKNILN